MVDSQLHLVFFIEFDVIREFCDLFLKWFKKYGIRFKSLISKVNILTFLKKG
jgi:hypothetical protein